jgi:hypothetical protein
MFAVSNYEHPAIFVRCRRTGETYRFVVESDGTLSDSEARFDQGDARRTAIAFLDKRSRAELPAIDRVATFAMVI